MPTHSTIEPDPNVVHTPLDDGDSVLLHLKTQTYFSLNETGSQIWTFVEQGMSVDEISQALCRRYNLSSEQALQSVQRLIRELQAQQLVTVS